MTNCCTCVTGKRGLLLKRAIQSKLFVVRNVRRRWSELHRLLTDTYTVIIALPMHYLTSFAVPFVTAEDYWVSGLAEGEWEKLCWAAPPE